MANPRDEAHQRVVAAQPAAVPEGQVIDQQPATVPDDQKAFRIAMMLGILQGDTYGATPATPIPKSAPSHPDNAAAYKAPQVVDPFDLAAQIDSARPDSSTTQAPDNGGTIYSGSFAHDLLAALNMPLTFSNVQAINAWMKAETGSQGPGTPAFNPLATTQKYGSYSNFNSVGVKNYSDYHTGVMATANVMVNGRYNDVLAALSRGNDAHAVGAAVAASPWGTGDGVLRVLGSH